MDAKQGTGEEDLSMEEILQSIRKIIADEGDEAGAAPKSNGAVAPESASDVLELTEVVAEEAPVAAQPADVLSSIDQAMGTPAAPAPAAQPPVAVAAAPTAPAGEFLLSDDAANNAAAALSKLKTTDTTTPYQASPSPVFNSGMTVENMVAEMLKPMMKSWLDANLPGIVERIVEREVKRLVR